MRTYQKRMIWVGASLAVLSVVAFLVVQALRDNLVFFYTATQVVEGAAKDLKHFRIGGMVESGSLKRDGVQISFLLTDGKNKIPVYYQGSLPDLFKEGKGAVADGKWNGQAFEAKTILAKHDENYMPPSMEHSMPHGAKNHTANPQNMPSLQQ
ncbi:cytochrome c maturation protein CcmE [Neisseriaceae bacterium B1]